MPRKKKISDAIALDIAAMHAQGVSIRQISQTVALSRSCVYTFLRSQGISTKPIDKPQRVGQFDRLPASFRTEVPCKRIMEQHTFEPAQDDYYCKHCGKPRALHNQDGFTPGTAPAIPFEVLRNPNPDFRDFLKFCEEQVDRALLKATI